MFVHLHNHSVYSLLDGSISIHDLVRTAKEMGMPAVALTDHGNMAGAVEFYKECRKEGIKPLVGCEIYMAPHGRLCTDHSHHDGEKDFTHLILIAKDWKGYQNLCRIVSAGWTKGFYRKPRADLDILKKWHEGLICTSACMAGAVPQKILQNDYEGALKIAEDYKKIFGDDFYIEVQNHRLSGDASVNESLIKIAEEIGAKVIASNDCHYLKKEDAESHEVMLAVQSGKKMKDNDRMRFGTDEFYFKSEEEMQAMFPQEYLDRTAEIADKCSLEMQFGINHLPSFPFPKEFRNENEYFEHICREGLNERLGEKHDIKYDERLDYEISVIEQMNFAGYFLIVQDFIRWAKENNILVGPGRGSAAGSLACYCMKITEIDPIRNNLLFERFLNPERVSMPDIDVDFPDAERYRVIDYVKEKYGADHVSRVAAFTGMKAKNSLLDSARAYDLPYAQSKKISDMIPENTPLEDAIRQNPQLKNAVNSSGLLRRIYRNAEGLQGNLRGATVHAGGVLIADRPITDYAPLMMAKDRNTGKKFEVVEYEKGGLEDMGLIKMDFLGLSTLSVIRNTLASVEKNHGTKIDISRIDPSCYPEVYEMLAEKDTIGVFQLESEGMTDTLKKMFFDIGRLEKAKTAQEKQKLGAEFFERMVAAIALYRPGPLDYIPEYIEGIRNPSGIHYDTPELRPILKDTYGVIVYQEQVQRICRDLAGFSYGQADIIRRAMSKKKADLLAGYKDSFIHGDENVRGCVAGGIPEKTAEAIWHKMEKFADYAFNKSHAVAYALVSFQTAYLKCYYEPEYMAALISSKTKKRDRLSRYINDCRTELNIPLRTPDINRSEMEFTSDGKSVMFGLAGISGIGEKTAEKIIRERRSHGNYSSLYDLCCRVPGLSKKNITSLIRSGTFDFTGYNRRELELASPDIMKAARDDHSSDAISLFSFIDEEVPAGGPEIRRRPDYSMNVLLMHEKETLSEFVSGNLMDCYRKTAEDSHLKSLGELTEFFSLHAESDPDIKIHSRICGIVSSIEERTTRKNTRMLTCRIEDGTVSVPAVIFDHAFHASRSALHDGAVAAIDCTISMRNGSPQIVIGSAVELLPDSNPQSRKISQMIKNDQKKKKGRYYQCRNHER